MIVTALDTLHISTVSPNSIAPGASFEVSDLEAAELLARGLVAEQIEPAPVAALAKPAGNKRA